MAKQKFNIGGKTSTQLAGDVAKPMAAYDGPKPPKDVYRGVLKQFKVKGPNTNGDSMLNGLVEIREPKSSKKAKFNGYALWFNNNISEQGAPWVNQLIDGLSGGNPKVRTAFWGKGVTTDDKTGLITNVGGLLKVVDGELEVRVSTKHDVYQGEDRQIVGSWLVAAAGNDDAPADDEDDDDETEDDEDSAELEEEDEDDEDDEESDDDEDDEDEDEDEDDDDETEDPSAVRQAELEGMERKELVAIAKSLSIKALKSKTDEKYIEEIIAVEFADEDDEDNEPPF